MTARIIIQGPPGSETVGEVLQTSFSDPSFTGLSVMVAFASEAGVDVLRTLLESAVGHLSGVRLAVGVDQGGTSREALLALLNLGIEVRIYYSTSRTIYHPKVYLFSGATHVRAVIGSSNLTVPGLFQNAEAAIVLDLSSTDPLAAQIAQAVDAFFDPGNHDWADNQQRLSVEVIDLLSTANILPDEAEREARQEKEESETVLETDAESIARLKVIFPPTNIPSLPPWVLAGRRPATSPRTRLTPGAEVRVVAPPPGSPSTGVNAPSVQPAAAQLPATPITRGPLLWKRPSLTPSDAQVVKSGSNPTGKLNLVQSGWNVAGNVIDHTRYFRVNVFGNSQWTPARTTPPVEHARVKFDVSILGVPQGVHILEVRHKPSGEAGQGNFTTSISWGPLGNAIRATNLTGRSLLLYGPPRGQPEPFFIEIV